jgi:hypothetical protein
LAIALLLLSLLAWNSLNPYIPTLLDTDSSVFAAVGLHFLEGKALYREAWDHKPPMIFFLDAVALWLGNGSVDAIRGLQRGFAVVGVNLFFSIVCLVFGSIWLAFFSSVFFLLYFYTHSIYGGGNFAEEYGSIFVLGGILAVVMAARARESSARAWVFFSGFLFSCAVLTKEPFILTSLPWFLFAILAADPEWKRRLWRGACFPAGALVPPLLWIPYFIRHQDFLDWLDTLDYGLKYVRISSDDPFIQRLLESLLRASEMVLSLTVTGKVALVFGILAAAHRPFLRRYHLFPLFCLYSLLCHFLGTVVSGRSENHYYLEVAGPFVLVGACGVRFLMDFAGQGKWTRQWMAIALALGVFCVDHRALIGYARGLAAPIGEPDFGPLVPAILAGSTREDRIWVSSGYLARLYVETGRLSPTRYLASFPHHFIDTARASKDQKIEMMINEIKHDPPKFIIAFVGKRLLHEVRPEDRHYTGWKELDAWIKEHYEDTGVEDEDQSGLLLVRIDQRNHPAQEGSAPLAHGSPLPDSAPANTASMQ